MLFLYIIPCKFEHTVVIFVKVQRCARGVLIPARHLGCTDNTHFLHAHTVHKFRGFKHGRHILAVYICLHLYTESFFLAQTNGAQGVLFCPFAVAEPIVMTDTVKRDLYQRIASDRAKTQKRLFVYEKTVGV